MLWLYILLHVYILNELGLVEAQAPLLNLVSFFGTKIGVDFRTHGSEIQTVRGRQAV